MSDRRSGPTLDAIIGYMQKHVDSRSAVTLSVHDQQTIIAALNDAGQCESARTESAAVQPIPREPTQAMVQIAIEHYRMTTDHYRSVEYRVARIWRAMHDAFTNEQPKSTEP